MTHSRPDQRGQKKLHHRNIHNQEYDFAALSASYPVLGQHIHINKFGNPSIDYADAKAVKALNAALLKHHYQIQHWDIPEGALCSPVPGRVDYIHYLAELLEVTDSNPADGNRTKVKMLDIGTGANGIYPLLASQIYGWDCVASDINEQSLANVSKILSNNPVLEAKINLRLQPNKHHIFTGIINDDESFDVTLCNPPFHSSAAEARKSSQRKVRNLTQNKQQKSGEKSVNSQYSKADSALNFGGFDDELWCSGGEKLFLKKLIRESHDFKMQCRWFSSLVSKAENLRDAKKQIQKLGATDLREIEMTQGNKITRIVVWTFQ